MVESHVISWQNFGEYNLICIFLYNLRIPHQQLGLAVDLHAYVF